MSRDQARLRAWVAALRSGEYRQTKHVLMRRNKTGRIAYCCVGVKAALEDVPSIRWDTDDSASLDCSTSSADLELSPEEIAYLADMNDSGARFAEIADWIEQKWITDPESAP